jgi:mannose-6-phosphate isomerase-like protein (cupin superfamily)
VLENSASGERIVIRRGGAETAGELLEFDVYLQPGAHVPAGHSHPRQVEHFHVIVGRVQFRIRGRSFWLGPGTRLTVSAGTSHWFGNRGDEVAQLRVEVRPALRMEEVFEAGVRCADASSAAWWLRLLDWLLIPRDFHPEVAVPGVSPTLVAAILGPLAWLRRSLRGAT